jgi:glycosyltransferase involved in cell wall biosynthesis
MRTQPIQILHFVDSFQIGGAERQFLHLARGLDGERFRLHVACLRRIGEWELETPCAAPLLREYRLGSLKSPRAWAQLVRFTAYLVRHGVDIVDATSVYPNAFALAAATLARTPVRIASVRDMGTMWTPSQLRLQRESCRLADAVVVNAEAVARRLRSEGYDPQRIEVIYNGIVVPPRPTRRPSKLRDELGLPHEAPLVGVVSRFHVVKRLEDFVDAAAILAERFPAAHFLVIGPIHDGVESERCAADIAERAKWAGLSGRFHLTDGRDDVAEILPELTVSVLASLSEGLSNTLLESMAAGVPVVATAVGGTPEIVSDGAHGLLVPVGDPSALAAAIGRLVASPELARRMGERGRERVLARFGRERMVAETLGLYERLLLRARAATGDRPAWAQGASR